MSHNALDVTALEQLVLERQKHKETIDALNQRVDTINAILADHLPAGGTVAGYTVTVTTPRRLDPRKIEAAFPVAQHPEFYKRAIDTTAVRKHIAEVELEQYMTEGKPTVTVK